MAVESFVFIRHDCLTHDLGNLGNRNVHAVLVVQACEQRAVACQYARRPRGFDVRQLADIRQVSPIRSEDGECNAAAGQHNDGDDRQRNDAREP